VYKLNGSTWSQIAKLTVADIPVDSRFGASVAIVRQGGCKILVGAPAYESAAGAVYVFDGDLQTCTTFTLQRRLRSSDIEAGDNFGHAIAGYGDSVIVGAPYKDAGSPSPNAGAAYFFTVSGSTWTERAKVKGRNFGGEHFGVSVDISTTRAVIGAPGYDHSSAKNCGRVYLYNRTSNTTTDWHFDRNIEPPTRTANGRFGQIVKGDDLGATVGEPGADHVGTDSGVVYEFPKAGGWAPKDPMSPSSAGEGTQYANTVDGNRHLAIGSLVAGSRDLSIGIFTNDIASRRSQTATITVPAGAAGTGFGLAMSQSFAALVVGAPYDDQAGQDAGAVYFYGVGVSNGEACTSSVQCASNFCVDGVCCDSACSGGTGDCQACSVAANGTSNGTCTPLSATRAPQVTCRAAAGVCDVPEVCSASSNTCPSNGFAGIFTECRNTGRLCDPAEFCPGNAATCPADLNLCGS
jgi:hypothetical protein